MKNRQLKKIIIFISGRGSNMKRIIEECQNGILKNIAYPVLVFSDNPDAQGLKIANESGIATQTINAKERNKNEFNKHLMELLTSIDFDYIILAGYMKILNPEIVKKYKNKIINIHPADTNIHQGLRAYNWAFENGLKKTKITVHYVDENIDTGKIIAQREVDLSGCKTIEEVEKRGLAVEHEFYSETLKKIFTNSI